MPTEPIQSINAEGWDALAEVLGIFRSVRESQSIPSVKLEMDSKGVVKPTVHCYSNDPYQAMKDCAEIFDMLRERYTLS